MGYTVKQCEPNKVSVMNLDNKFQPSIFVVMGCSVFVTFKLVCWFNISSVKTFSYVHLKIYLYKWFIYIVCVIKNVIF